MNYSKLINIGGKSISDDLPVFIIAEIGVNHNGDMKVAKKLIDLAIQAGVDAVKFQTFQAEHLILENVNKAPYQLQTTSQVENQYQMLKKLEVTREQNFQLKNYCQEKGVIFLTTPFDEVSLSALDELDLQAYKIASTDLTNLPFLKKIAEKNKPIILSTGMSYYTEVEKAVREISEINKDIILLQCTANYPVVDKEANLKVLKKYKDDFKLIVGFSDHTEGIGAGPYAVALGAKVIEKHFTLDKSLPGPDHKASLSPQELTEFVREIRKVEEYLGTDSKIPTLSELKTREILQKHLVASKDIRKGELYTEDNIIAKRTGGVGISPLYFNKLKGQRSNKNYKKNEVLEL